MIISVLAFLLLSLLPGDPAIIIAGEQASPAAIEQVRRQLGLDRPFFEQLAIWLFNLARGDFGSSLILHQSVLSAVVERLPVTLSLAALSISFTIPVGVLLGSVAAYFRRTWIDSLVMTTALLGVSIPAFWIAILGVILFSVQLGWVPSSGFAPISQGVGPWFSSIALPALILSLFQIGFLARMTRSAMLDVLGQDYIRTARAKGAQRVADRRQARAAQRADPDHHRHRHSAECRDRRLCRSSSRYSRCRGSAAWWCRRSWRAIIRWCRARC